MRYPTKARLKQLVQQIKTPIYIDGLFIDNLLQRMNNSIDEDAITLLKLIHPILDDRQKKRILSACDLSSCDLELLFLYDPAIEPVVNEALCRINELTTYNVAGLSGHHSPTRYDSLKNRYLSAVIFLQKNQSKIPASLKENLVDTFTRQFLSRNDLYHQTQDDYHGKQLPLLVVADQLRSDDALKIIEAISQNFSSYLERYSETLLFRLIAVLVNRVAPHRLDVAITALKNAKQVQAFRCLNLLLEQKGENPCSYTDVAISLDITITRFGITESRLDAILDQAYSLIKKLSLKERMDLVHSATTFLLKETSLEKKHLRFFVLLSMHYAVRALFASDDLSQEDRTIIIQQQQKVLEKLGTLEPAEELFDFEDIMDSDGYIAGHLKAHCDFLTELKIPYHIDFTPEGFMFNEFKSTLTKNRDFRAHQKTEIELRLGEAMELETLLEINAPAENNADALLDALQNQYNILQQKFNTPNCFQRLLGLNNTWQWQKECYYFRRFALEKFEHALSTSDENIKYTLIDKAQKLTLFNEHRDNYTFSDKTNAVRDLERMAQQYHRIDLNTFP